MDRTPFAVEIPGIIREDVVFRFRSLGSYWTTAASWAAPWNTHTITVSSCKSIPIQIIDEGMAPALLSIAT
jgi:hypothetical protein